MAIVAVAIHYVIAIICPDHRYLFLLISHLWQPEDVTVSVAVSANVTKQFQHQLPATSRRNISLCPGRAKPPGEGNLLLQRHCRRRRQTDLAQDFILKVKAKHSGRWASRWATAETVGPLWHITGDHSWVRPWFNKLRTIGLRNVAVVSWVVVAFLFFILSFSPTWVSDNKKHLMDKNTAVLCQGPERYKEWLPRPEGRLRCFFHVNHRFVCTCNLHATCKLLYKAYSSLLSLQKWPHPRSCDRFHWLTQDCGDVEAVWGDSRHLEGMRIA